MKAKKPTAYRRIGLADRSKAEREVIDGIERMPPKKRAEMLQLLSSLVARSRSELHTAIARVVDAFSDRDCHGAEGETQYHECVRLLSTVDWGSVQPDGLKKIFAAIIENVGARPLSDGNGAQGDGSFLTMCREMHRNNERYRRQEKAERKRAA